MRWFLIITLAWACAKPVDPISVYEMVPHLPAPEAGTYSRGSSQSSDAAVAFVVGQRPWDASLSGAAAGMALGLTGEQALFQKWEIREAAWRAGYPYPVGKSIRAWGPAGGPPPDVLLEWLRALPLSQDLGLVRARAARGDLWVGLAAEVTLPLPVIPRRIMLGERLSFTPDADGVLTLSSPEGDVSTHTLERGFDRAMEQDGEWLVERKHKGQQVALFPVYVGIEVPNFPVLREATSVEYDDPLEAMQHVMTVVREIYERPAFERTVLLDAGARTLLNHPQRDVGEVVSALGLSSEGAVFHRCATTLTRGCMDKLLWDIKTRSVFVSPSRWVLGLAASLSEQEQSVVILLVRDVEA
jgi:hypothetical protein